ncbi:MAG: ABC transporter ATP-binding protein [Syntrophaceae bacterium]|nr:ABC transporter ATP-binding protein [Syntrophaceae bacterium]
MARITLCNISNFACRDVNLQINAGEKVVLMGATGAGKTTLLNVIAGLVPYTGQVWFDDVCVKDLAARKRNIGYLFQDIALFPHLTVSENVAYGLSVRGVSKSATRKRVDELLALVRLDHLKDQYPLRLSGGEKQRTALARALAPEPKVLLLDEPFSSLDLLTAKYLRTEMRSIFEQLKMTVVHVTHNIFEAQDMADRIAVIHKGKIEQIASPQDLLFHPASPVVSDLIGTPNILVCDKSRILASGLLELWSGNLKLILPYEGNGIEKVAILPQDIYVSIQNPPGPSLNRYKGIVKEIIHASSNVKIKIEVDGENLISEVSGEIFRTLNLKVNQSVFVIIKLRRLRFFETNLSGN